MELFEQEEFYECATRFSVAESPLDVATSWLALKGKFQELSGVIHLDDYDRVVLPECIRKYTKEPFDYLVPYFKSERLYFIDDDMLEAIFHKGKVYFPIDYTVMFDTNIASYINRLVRGESIGNVQGEFLRLVDELLRDDLNFDFLFYLVENIKTIMKKADFASKSKLGFWLSLDKSFRENLCSLHLFASIDCQEYKKTLNPKFTVSHRQAVRNAINAAYGFYFENKHTLDDFMLLQRNLLLNLIGMVRVQEESNKNERNKMKVYLQFMHESVGMYMDREAIIAHKYFSSRNNLPILKEVHKRCETHKLLKKLDNIAWDMAAPRIMEQLIPLGMGSDGHYFVPMFLSFDKNLKKMLKMHPIKGAIYNRDTSDIVPFPDVNSGEYFTENKLEKEINWICGEELKLERRKRPRHTRGTVHKSIIKEYRKLLVALKP